MNPVNSVIITKEGLTKLKAEYDELLTKRQLAVDRVAKAREMGDLSENAEYQSAREELSFTDGRLAELEEMLKDAKAVTISNNHKHQVNVGCKVTVHVNGKKDIFYMVGEWEANPMEKKISHVSPLGQALLGKKVGEKVEVDAPVGKIVYTITNIE